MFIDAPRHRRGQACYHVGYRLPAEVTEASARCGHIEVPRDHSKPDGEKISVGVLKVPAKQKSRGSLFINPGGPGGSVYDLFHNGSLTEIKWPQEIRNEWDIIAVQPRGLAESTPLECELLPTSDPATLANYGTKLKQACDEKQPSYMEQVNTNNTADNWE
ncbi:MAG: hypothetical protein Q4A82_00670 [Corynebacterium sp.]|nr:hypothetical protein [Corynebacterium sp.]